MRKLARTDRSRLSEWWWTVDRYLLVGALALIISGVVMGMAASPATAHRLDLPSFYFVQRHLVFLIPSSIAMLVVSFFRPREVLAFATVLLVVSLALVVATLFLGVEVKGARRWLDFGFFSLQPSELLKPAFVVVMAFLLSQAHGRQRLLSFGLASLLYLVTVFLLTRQPDFGQTMLVTLVTSVLLLLSGISLLWIVLLVGLGSIAAFLFYQNVPHVTSRVDRFLNPESGDTYQVDKAMEAFQAGGLLGRGMGEGAVNRVLPDAHTDFIFAVTAEEFGIWVCLLLVLIYCGIVLRGLSRAFVVHNTFIQMAISGLVALFGIQALINMAVNMKMIPAKGMTLPFISYGGTSLLSVALTIGMILALTRRDADDHRHKLVHRMPKGVFA